MADHETTLFERIGGLPTLRKVHKIFYDKVYDHYWLKKYFDGHNQESIENRQTSFMAEKMGGPMEYWGKQPVMAHRQLYITQKLFDIRQALLRDSTREAGLSDELTDQWLEIDSAFTRAIVKDSIESFYQTTWKYERRIIIPEPVKDS
ncbi:MAG: group 1 truncated hemoglobin [Gammaproteobacteria bacterium]